MNELVQLQVLNSIGQVIFDAQISNMNLYQIDLSGYPSGMFHIRVLIGSETITKRIIKR